ncbi:MAG: glutamine--fructose-6-phosphate transaminase (isomerizing) [Candidatus Thermoplasmatota archaeon]|nr:glutamine--fructose-6-phosphate transaminase (isomerizing) [Candidatus Thermoplasmatota archaeon]
MCGIVGYVGHREATDVLIEALKRLEYRGYDSSGLATLSTGRGKGRLRVLKSPGYISALEKRIKTGSSRIGISHTRWATHGVPNEVNAHPHMDGEQNVAVVHNGIIDNHLALKRELARKGHEFLSQTDTEVIPHLISEEYRHNGGNLFEAVREVVKRLKGSYAIVVLHRDHPDILVCAREKSPLVLGTGVNEGFIASDVTALLRYTNRFIFMEDGEIAKVAADGIHIEKISGGTVAHEWTRVDWSLEDAEKGGFKHFMIKEIFEQPRSLHQSQTGWRSDENSIPADLATARIIRIVACGTSYHAGMVGRYLFEKFTGLPTIVSMASEYRFADATSDDPLMIFITQSGETLDTIMAAREARSRGLKTVAITNVVGSTITRETDLTLYMRSGPEIGVAASKTFTSQLMMMYLFSSYLGYRMGYIKRDDLNSIKEHLRHTIRSVEGILNNTGPIREMAEWFSGSSSAFFLGRYVNYPAALEGALKMKEISYIHSEGYPAGELKHGPLALLTEKTPIVALVAGDHTYEKMLGNIGECSARGSPVVAIAPDGDVEIGRYTDRVLHYPRVDPLFSPIPISVLLQLLAYYTADHRGCPIDKPRNLAKSVTVE